MNRPTPETKWYVTEYPNECDFAVTDGNEILVTIIGGNTIGDQCDLASRIAKLPDLERECEEAIDKYQSLQKTFEEWQLKFLSEQAELLDNKDVQHDKLFDEAYQIRIERDEARAERDICLEDFIKARKHREQLNSLLQSYEACWDEIKAALGEPEEGDQTCDLDRVLKAIRERDEAREDAAKWESSSDAMERAGAEQARRADENREWALKAERERDEAKAAIRALAEHGESEIQRITKERDEAREALKKIKHIFINGGDTYLDFVKVGNIATDYLEGL